jgi:hypothetical protein
MFGRRQLPATATKADLEQALVRHRMNLYPSLYAGHEDDALFFVRNQGPSRKQLLLTAQCYGLAERSAK